MRVGVCFRVNCELINSICHCMQCPELAFGMKTAFSRVNLTQAGNREAGSFAIVTGILALMDWTAGLM